MIKKFSTNKSATELLKEYTEIQKEAIKNMMVLKPGQSITFAGKDLGKCDPNTRKLYADDPIILEHEAEEKRKCYLLGLFTGISLAFVAWLITTLL
jgi:hypothetical protein